MKIVGIAGTNGAGKDTVGTILADDYGWLFISVTDILRDELKKRNLPIERENLRNLSAEWRRQSGLGALIDKAAQIFKDQSKPYEGLAIASLRNPGEASRVQELGGQVIWVDADSRLRFNRISVRGRGAEDQKTYAEFLAEEQAEMEHTGDEATLNMVGVKSKADIFIHNDDGLESIKSQVKAALKL